MLRVVIFLLLAGLGISTYIGQAGTLTLNVSSIASVDKKVEWPPPPPTGLSAYPQGQVTAAGRFSIAIAEAVQVTWAENDPGEGVTEYRVYRAQDYSGDFDRIGTTAGPAFTDHAVEEGETYVYYVTAVNKVGESPPSDEASAQLPAGCEGLEPDTEDYDTAVADGDCPRLEPTPTPTGEAAEALEAETLDAEATAESTSTPQPTPTGTPFPTRTPSPVPTATSPATATPVPTETPQPTQTPLPTQTQQPTVQPTPTEAPADTPAPEPSDTPEA